MVWRTTSTKYVENDTTLVVARPALVMEFYGNSSGANLAPHAGALLDRFLALLPADQELYVLGCNDRRYRQVTQRSQRRIRKVLSDGGGFFSFKTTPDFEVGDYSLELSIGSESEWDTDTVVFGFPLDWGEAPLSERASGFFLSMVTEYPFWGAVASYGFDLVWGREFEQIAMPEHIRLALRYHGLLIRNRLQEASLVEEVNGSPVEKLKSVGWLTYLGEKLSANAGGYSRLAEIKGLPDIKVTPVGRGIALMAGNAPPLGDINRLDRDVEPLARVGHVLADLHLRAWNASALFQIADDRSNAWLSRFD